MAITPVQRQQRQVHKPSKTGEMLGKGFGAIGTVVGGVLGAAPGVKAGQPGAAIWGGTKGAALGGSSGRGFGQLVGGLVDPAKTSMVEEVTPSPIPRFSPQAQSFIEALQILQKMPSSISAHHTGPITAALMQDIAHNRRA